MSDVLFDLPDGATLPAGEELSAGGRRRVRQAEAVANGVHPLALVIRGVRMHPDADRTATSSDRPNLPLRCGSCWHRFINRLGNAYPKCGFSASRVSHGAATDIRSWWPACDQYSAGDPSLSPDAARCLPEDSSHREETVPASGGPAGTVPPRQYGDVVFDPCGHGEDWHGPDGCEARGCPCEVPR